MALVLADRVNETTTTAGTGTLTLAGAVSGYQSFSVIGNANTTYYTIVHQTANEWEVGIGTYTSAGTTLSRDTVLASSAGGTTKVTFSAGTKFVFCDYPAGKAIYQDASGSTYVPGLLAGGSSSANYVQITGAATTVAPKITAQGSDTNIDLAFSTKGTGWYSFFGNNSGIQTFQMQNISSAVNWIRSFNSVSTFKVGLSAQGSDTDVGFIIQSKGTGAINLQTAGGTTQLAVTDTASAVNYVQVTGAATGSGNYPTISSQGSDAVVNISVDAKGAANARLRTTATGGWIQLVPGVEAFRATGVASAVNFHQVQNSATGNALVYSAQGTDTNISMVFQPKGTGAIDLAAGSSGVNISNGGTVTALTRTATGTSYTSSPTVAISAPTTAGGVQATATSTIRPDSVTIVSGGTGYTLNDVLTAAGGTFTTAFTITVTGVSGGVITSVSIANFGAYTVAPSNAVSVTGGTGSGATFNVTNWGINSTLTITNAGSGYVEQPTVTFSGGGGAGAAAYASVGGIPVFKSLNNVLSFNVASGEALRINNQGFSTLTDYVEVQGGASVAGAYIGVNGSTATASLYASAKGGGAVRFFTNGQGVTEQFRVAHTASAVNYVQVTGAATTAIPVISAAGSDASIPLALQSKLTSPIVFQNGSAQRQLRIDGTGTGVNYVGITSAGAGSAPILNASAQSSDTNVGLNIQSKGTGTVNIQTAGGTTQLAVTDTASAVNYVQVTGSATGVNASIQAVGSDINVGLSISSKGANNVNFWTSSLGSRQFSVAHTAGTIVNYSTATGSATGAAPVFGVAGTDTNIDLTLTPKGTGKVVVTNGIQGGSF